MKERVDFYPSPHFGGVLQSIQLGSLGTRFRITFCRGHQNQLKIKQNQLKIEWAVIEK